MNMGKLITQLKQALSVPAGSSYIVAMGDGTGTKRVTHETVVESIGRDLPLGDTEELKTENKSDIVGAVNEIVQKLALVGIAYRGSYDPEAEYRYLNAVFYENSTFIAMKDNPEGTPAADGVNWQYLAKGFMDGYLVAKSQIVNNLLATKPGNVLDAVQGKALADMIDGINSNLPVLVSDNFGNQHSGCLTCDPSTKTVYITCGLYSDVPFATKTLVYRFDPKYAPKSRKSLYGIAQRNNQLFMAQLVIDTDGSVTYYGSFGDGSCDLMFFSGSYYYG